MTVRRVRGASLGVAGALVAGLVIAPTAGGAVAAGPDGPAFYSVDAVSAPASSAGDASARVAAASARLAKAAAVAKGIQVLQVLPGVNGIGADGLTVAAGQKHVVQMGGNNVRIMLKNTGAVKKNQQLAAFFGLSGLTVTDGTIVYDPLAKRWFAAAVVVDGAETGLVLRASQDTTPLKWQPAVRFADPTIGTNPDLNTDAVELDPSVGTSTDKVVVTTPVTDADEPSNVNRIFFFPKTPLVNGLAPDPWAADLNSTYNGQAPAVNGSSQANIFVAIPATNDVTVTTYTGAATTLEPNFSKNVVYPASALTVPPTVDQGPGEDTLDLGPLTFTGVAWRSGQLFATAAGNCAGDGCVRLIGVGTEAGVALIEDEKLKLDAQDLFSPSVAIDGAGYVHVAAQVASADGNGPSLATYALTQVSLASAATIKARTIDVGDGAFDENGTPGGSSDWGASTGAAMDPTSPWDVWVTGAAGSSTVATPNLTTSVARVSMAKNAATIKASDTKVNQGAQVTFTLKLTRPDTKNAIKGLPVALQRKGGGQWKKIVSGETNKKGVFKATVTVKNAGQYRTLGKAVTQVAGEGTVFDKVASSPVTIQLN